MQNTAVLLSIILVPFIGSFTLPLVGRFSLKARDFLALFFVCIAFVGAASLVPAVFNSAKITFTWLLPLGFNLAFNADGLAVFMALVSSFISAVIVFYSFGYIKHYDNQNEYYLMVVLFLGSMMGLVFSSNLILLYLFWEITAICSWRLIGFFRSKEDVQKADKAFLVTVFGAVLMLAGFIMLYQQAGSFDLLTIEAVLKNHPVAGLTILFILAGIFSKSATLPFQTWLPDAGVAPSPVTALLHAAVLVKIGVYVFARLFIVTIPIPGPWQMVVMLAAAASALIAAGSALMDTNLKRIIAYSTISQIGFIFLGFALMTEVGVVGALLYILMHGLAKGGLFLCAGIVEHNTGTKNIKEMGGLIKTMPFTAWSFLFCSFAIMGIPPFGGFFSKYLVISGTLFSRHNVIALLFLICAVLTILYLFRIFNMVFLGESRCGKVKEGSWTMVASVVILAVLSLAAGIFIYYPFSFAEVAAKQMLGGI